MKQIFIIIVLFSLSKLFAQDSTRYKYNKAGFAVQLGIGLLYGGLGPVFEYQIKYKEKIRITPMLGTGFSIGGPPDQSDTVHSEGIWINSAIGINLEYGNKHRLIFGPQLISAYYNSEILPESADKRLFLGFSIIAGYKGTASFGLIWQVYAGLAHMQAPLMTGKNSYLAPNVGLGLGYKF
jgi:hypothetical protein